MSSEIKRWGEGEYINIQDIININTSESTMPLAVMYLTCI
jgi:hypothetical protein